MMIRKIILTVIIFLFVNINLFVCYSQSCSSTFTYPDNLSDNVELIPRITLRTDCKIDSSSIKSFDRGGDSARMPSYAPPSILVIPKFFTDSIPDSLWKYLSIQGEYELLDTNRLSFKPFELMASIEYIAIVANLKAVINTDTISVSENSITFTTIPPAHQIVGFSYKFYDLINCEDTLEVVFNRKLDSATSAMGDIIELFKIDSIIIINDTIMTRYTTSIDLNAWIDQEDSSIVRALPLDQLATGSQYIVKVNTSYLSGDSLMDDEAIITVRERYEILMQVVVVDTTIPPPINCTYPSGGSSILQYDDEIDVWASLEVDSLIFIRWECPQIKDIDSLQINHFTIKKSCYELENLQIKAVYSLKDSVLLQVTVDSNLICSVYNDNRLYLGGPGQYKIAPDEYLFVEVDGDTTNKFSHWTSSEQWLNTDDQEQFARKGGKDRIQFINPLASPTFPCVPNQGRNISMNGHIQGAEPLAAHGINLMSIYGDYLGSGGEYWLTENGGLPFNEGLIQYFISDSLITEYQYSTGNQQEMVEITFKINEEFACGEEDLFCIHGIIGTDTIVDCGEPPYPQEITINVPSKSNFAEYYVFVYPIEIQSENILTIQAEWTDGHFGTGQIGVDVSVKAEVLTPLGTEVLDTYWLEPNGTPILIQHLFCKQKVRLTAISQLTYEFGFELEKWKDNDADYSYPDPSNLEQWTITVDEDSKVKAIFNEGFRLTEIGAYRDNDRDDNTHVTDITWIPIKKEFSLEDVVIDNLEVYNYDLDEEDGYMTKILFKFNDEIEASDFYNNIIVKDISDRIDGVEKMQYILTQQNCEIDLQNFPDGNVLEFFVKNTSNNYSIPKGEEFEIWFDDDIENSNRDNIPLAQVLNNYTIKTFITEIPGIIVKLKSVKAGDDYGSFFEGTNMEFFAPWAASIGQWNFETNKVERIILKWGQYPSTSDYLSLKKHSSFKPSNYHLIETNQMMFHDLLHYQMGFYDFDGIWMNDFSDDFRESEQNKYYDIVHSRKIIDPNIWGQNVYEEHVLLYIFDIIAGFAILYGILESNAYAFLAGIAILCIVLFLGYAYDDYCGFYTNASTWQLDKYLGNESKKTSESDAKAKFEIKYKKKEVTGSTDYYNP